jgi:protease I
MTMRKPVAILVQEGYQDLEFWYPLLRLREEGTPVVVIGPEADRTYFSQLEYPVIPDIGIADAKPAEFAAVLVPGGAAAKAVGADSRMQGFLRAAASAGALLAGTAEGAAAIAAAGGKDVRTLTARSTDDLPEFCKALFRALA